MTFTKEDLQLLSRAVRGTLKTDSVRKRQNIGRVQRKLDAALAANPPRTRRNASRRPR
jgi:hypothetical protein